MMNIEPTVRVNPYTDDLIPPPPPPKRHSKILRVLILALLILSMLSLAYVSYSVGISSAPTPATPTPIDAGATATVVYEQGAAIQSGIDSNVVAATATAAYNQGYADDQAGNIKWLHDKCTKDGNGNYTVFVKNGELWCY
jgi:hypothetical protein